MSSVSIEKRGDKFDVSVNGASVTIASSQLSVVCHINDIDIAIFEGVNGIKFGNIQCQSQSVFLNLDVSEEEASRLHQEFPEIAFIKDKGNYKKIMAMMKAGDA